MQPHPEHQQDHADFSELAGNAHIPHETGSERAYCDAGDEIAHDRWQAYPGSEVPEYTGQDEAHRDQCDECCIVMHLAVSSSVTQFKRQLL